MNATTTVPGAAPFAASPVRPRPVYRRKFLVVTSLLVVAVLILPLFFLLLEASSVGLTSIWHVFWRSLTATLLWGSLQLTVMVTTLCALVGTLAAYGVERTDLPGRRAWAVLVVVPFAIPDFVLSFGWSSLFGWAQGLRGAVLVMTLGSYPLVYLPVAASFRGADPGQEEVARSLGASRLSVFWRVTLGQARAAVLGGCLLVALVMLAEYGAFEILGFRTFTTEIFSELTVGFGGTAPACALSLVLVTLSLLVLCGERLASGTARSAKGHKGAQRPLARLPLGRAKAPVLVAYGALVAGALGLPIGACTYWMVKQIGSPLAGVPLGSAALHTAGYSAAAAFLATLGALPVALLAVRAPGRFPMLLERSTYLVLAVPGLVVALALTYFSEQHADGFGYQSGPMLVFAYAILFFPLALVGARSSLAQSPGALEDVAGSLGASRAQVFRRVTLPLIGPGLAAAFALVFLSAVTELTATLVLVPTGVQTLATQFWAYEQNLSYGQAAPFALAIIGIAAVPSYLVARFFDRLPTRQQGPPARLG